MVLFYIKSTVSVYSLNYSFNKKAFYFILIFKFFFGRKEEKLILLLVLVWLEKKEESILYFGCFFFFNVKFIYNRHQPNAIFLEKKKSKFINIVCLISAWMKWFAGRQEGREVKRCRIACKQAQNFDSAC